MEEGYSFFHVSDGFPSPLCRLILQSVVRFFLSGLLDLSLLGLLTTSSWRHLNKAEDSHSDSHRGSLFQYHVELRCHSTETSICVFLPQKSRLLGIRHFPMRHLLTIMHLLKWNEYWFCYCSMESKPTWNRLGRVFRVVDLSVFLYIVRRIWGEFNQGIYTNSTKDPFKDNPIIDRWRQLYELYSRICNYPKHCF